MKAPAPIAVVQCKASSTVSACYVWHDEDDDEGKRLFLDVARMYRNLPVIILSGSVGIGSQSVGKYVAVASQPKQRPRGWCFIFAVDVINGLRGESGSYTGHDIPMLIRVDF